MKTIRPLLTLTVLILTAPLPARAQTATLVPEDASFTLARPLSADATVVPVVESIDKMSTTTGFFVRNSVTLQIDDELITYGGVARSDGPAFTACQRGVLGTQVATHAARNGSPE